MSGVTPVVVDAGFGWTPILLLILNALGISGLLVAWVKIRPQMQEIAQRREANLLKERADDMTSMREELKAIKTDLERQREEHAEERKILYRQRDAERAISRHRINNLNQAFNALLMLLKKGVTVEDAVAEVEKLRAEQLDREAAEVATYNAAGITLEQEARA